MPIHNEAGVVESWVGGPDSLDENGVSPVVAEVVGIGEALDAGVDERAELRLPGVNHRDPDAIRIGDAVVGLVSARSDVELEEMVVLEQHDGLYGLVQGAHRRRQRNLGAPPDHGLGVIEGDLDAGDAVDVGGFRAHAANVAAAVSIFQRQGSTVWSTFVLSGQGPSGRLLWWRLQNALE